MGSLPRLVVNLKPFSASIYFQGLSQLCFCLPPWQRSHSPSSLSNSLPLPTSLELARLKKIPQQCLESGLEEWRQCSFSPLLWSWHTPPSPSTWATMKMIDMKNGIEESRSTVDQYWVSRYLIGLINRFVFKSYFDLGDYKQTWHYHNISTIDQRPEYLKWCVFNFDWAQFLFHWKYLHKPCQNGPHQFLKAYQASLEYLMEKCVIQNPQKERKSDQNVIQNHPQKKEKWSKWET